MFNNIKKELDDYEFINKEIIDLEEKIKKLEQEKETSISVSGSLKDYPYTRTHYKVNAKNPKYINELNKLMDIYKSRHLTLMKKNIEIEKFINDLPTSRLRLIFEYKYIKHYTWRKIAYIIGGMATEESIRKEHDRFFKN